MELLDMNFYMAQTYYLAWRCYTLELRTVIVNSRKIIGKKQGLRDGLYRVQILEIYKLSSSKRNDARTRKIDILK
jgi:hypothetical protein